MKKNKVILIGAINEGKIATCGETIKNQMLLEQFRYAFDEVITVDTLGWNKRPWILVKLLLVLMFCKNAKVVLSASRSVRYIIKFLYYVPLQKNIYFWVIGGNMANLLRDGIYELKFFKKLNLIIAEGESMVKELTEMGLENVIRIPNFKKINYLPQKKEYNEENVCRFVFLSRVHPDKGIPEIFSSAKVLNDKGYKDRFIIDFYGAIEPAYNDEFLQNISFLSNVNYKGFLNLNQNEGYDILSSYDVMLFPTYWDGEGFPGIFIDAFISSLPVIASSWSMNTDVIKDNETGWIISPHSTKELVNKMEYAINSVSDICRLSSNCRKEARKYDSRTVLSKQVLQEIGLL